MLSDRPSMALARTSQRGFVDVTACFGRQRSAHPRWSAGSATFSNFLIFSNARAKNAQEVCKTFDRRFDSRRRLTTPSADFIGVLARSGRTLIAGARRFYPYLTPKSRREVPPGAAAPKATTGVGEMNCRICDACSVVCATAPVMIQACGWPR